MGKGKNNNPSCTTAVMNIGLVGGATEPEGNAALEATKDKLGGSIWDLGTDPDLMAMGEDAEQEAAIAAINAGKEEAQEIQQGAYDEALELQAKINNAQSYKQAERILKKYDQSRELKSSVARSERQRLLQECLAKSPEDRPAYKAMQERESWPAPMREMAEKAVVEPVGVEPGASKTPLASLLHSDDFIELRKNWVVSYMYENRRFPTSTPAEDMIKGPVAGLGGKEPDPDKPVCFYWENPDTVILEGEVSKSKLYFIQMYPSYSDTDPFDIVIDMEDVEQNTSEQHRVAVKSPKDNPRDKSDRAEFQDVQDINRQTISIPFHSIDSSEINDPDKLLDRTASTLLGGEKLFWTGAVDDRVGKAPIRSWTGIRMPDDSVRRAIVLARHASVPGQEESGVKKKFVVKPGADRGRYEWEIPVPQQDGSLEYVTIVHPAYYAATKSGKEATRNGSLVPVPPLPNSGATLKVPAKLAPLYLRERYLWDHRS